MGADQVYGILGIVYCQSCAVRPKVGKRWEATGCSGLYRVWGLGVVRQTLRVRFLLCPMQAATSSKSLTSGMLSPLNPRLDEKRV